MNARNAARVFAGTLAMVLLSAAGLAGVGAMEPGASLNLWLICLACFVGFTGLGLFALWEPA